MPTVTISLYEDALIAHKKKADYPTNNTDYRLASGFRGSRHSQSPITPDQALPFSTTPEWDRRTGKKYGYDRPDQRGNRIGADLDPVMYYYW